MLIKGEKKYIDTLCDLWHEVFCDSKDYIKLFFSEAYPKCECFAEMVDGKAVSALYLLECDLHLDGKIFKGRYLYAAATLNAYRSKGIMGRLIEQAKLYCENEGIDFIALVPASDSLYGYYEKFGFHTAMYKYRYEAKSGGDEEKHSFKITQTSLDDLRRRYKKNMLVFSRDINAYAEKAFSFADVKLFENDGGAYFISDETFSEIYEFLPACEQDEKELLRLIKEGGVVYTPAECCFLGAGEKIRNGMIFSASDAMKKENFSGDIYMNIALD